MKKISVLLLASTFLGLPVIASGAEVKSEKLPVVSDLTVKLTGYGHFQAGFLNQSHLGKDEKNVSANRKDFAFFNDAAMFADISNSVDNFTYGGKLVLVPTAKIKGSPTYNGSHIYFESEFGRVEAGSPFDAASNMFTDASAIASATGGDWDRYAKLPSAYINQGKDYEASFATFAEFYLDSKLVTNDEKRPYSKEPGRRISYYTPKFDVTPITKVQLGVSYTPDSSNTGADSPSANSSGFDKKYINGTTEYFSIDKSIKNAISGGVAVEQNFTDGVDLKVSATGEFGKAAKASRYDENVSKTTPIETYKLANMRTYNVGAVLAVGNISYAGSYGSLGKSLTNSKIQKAGRDTTYYTAGVAYKQGSFSASVSYFHSTQYKNKLNCITIGTDYKLAPGLKPYVEVSQFDLNGKPEYHPELKNKKTRGTVALIGAKLSL